MVKSFFSVMSALFIATAMQTLPGALSSTLGGRLQNRLPIVHHESKDGLDFQNALDAAVSVEKKEIAASNAFWKPSATEDKAEEQRKREEEQSGKTLHDLEIAAKREEDSKRRVASHYLSEGKSNIEAARQQGLRDQEAKTESQKKVAEIEAARQQGLRDQDRKQPPVLPYPGTLSSGECLPESSGEFDSESGEWRTSCKPPPPSFHDSFSAAMETFGRPQSAAPWLAMAGDSNMVSAVSGVHSRITLYFTVLYFSNPPHWLNRRMMSRYALSSPSCC